MRRILKIVTSRLLIIVPLFMLQLAAVIGFFYRITLVTQLTAAMNVLSIALVAYVINRNNDPAYKIAWCITILALPVLGIPLYLLAGNRKVPRKLFSGTIKATKEMDGLLEPVPHILDNEPEQIRNMFNYGEKSLGMPVYGNTESRYFSSGEEWFPVYLEELKKAERFIFLEYFIIDEGTVLDEVLAILKQKVQEGVKVKMIYDDFGSITMPRRFIKELRASGIEAYRFNHIRPALIFTMNNRSHRKVTVIDNKVAFTGGVNLADEYVNRIVRFGYWKDSAIMIRGDAVWSFTVMFLGMLSYVRGDDPVNYPKYRLSGEPVSDGGYYQPFSDTPTDDEQVSMNVHMNLIRSATKYLYIDTPYLILTESVRNSLILAAKDGVDVRIMTPHIPDKKIVFQITRGNYLPLLRAGVKIYEYTPGFDHCKNFVADDSIALVGSVNMDYRSYFLHFENGVLFYKSPQIIRIRENFESAMEQSHEVTLYEMEHTNLAVRLIRALLSILIPLV